jgi:hypothetical protein
MSEIEQIEQVVLQAAKRERWHRAWAGAWQGLLAGSALWLLALVLYKVAPIPIQLLHWTGIASLSLVGWGAIWRGWKPKTPVQTARWVDNKEAFKERLSTALELDQNPTSKEWTRLLIADAARHAQTVDLKRLLPWNVPRASRWILALLALGAGLGWVPEYRSKAYVQKQIDAEVIHETGKNLSELTRRQLKTQPPVLPQVKEKLESLAELGERMTTANLTRNEALKDLASVVEKLKMEAKQLAQNPAIKRMEQAARNRSGNGSQTAREAAALQKKIEDLQKQLGGKGADQEKLENLKQDLQKAKEAAAAMASESSSKDSAAKEQLSQSLSALQQKAGEMGLSLPNLDQALEALAKDQAEIVMKQLQEMDKNLDKLKEMAQTLQQLQKSGDPQIGKDLAEQLKKGQAKSAQETLEKLAKQLNAQKLTKAELKKILEEVKKAQDPAGDYGQVANLLKQAEQKMEQGQNGEAAEKLAAAAKELENLSNELGDMEDLKSALEALGRAQMAVGNGDLGNGQNFMKGLGRPGRGKGGKGGRGFGDWVDEEGWQAIPEMSELWDNDADDRGQLDPRSNKDRGEGALADNLDPTRLRGQMNQGGPMPSITLRGVSIKGQSRIAIDEAVMGAQSDAQNALNQEQIPKAYQNSVKDYFDDLKK